MTTTPAYLPGDAPAAPDVAAPDPYWFHDTRQPLDCVDAPTLNRRIGVIAARFHHHTLNAEYIDVRRETVTVNTAERGMSYPAGEAAERIRIATEATIADLDRVIGELATHRARLAAELSSVDRKAGAR